MNPYSFVYYIVLNANAFRINRVIILLTKMEMSVSVNAVGVEQMVFTPFDRTCYETDINHNTTLLYNVRNLCDALRFSV